MLFGAPEFQHCVIPEMAKHEQGQKRENCSKIVRRGVSVKSKSLLCPFSKPTMPSPRNSHG